MKLHVENQTLYSQLLQRLEGLKRLQRSHEGVTECRGASTTRVCVTTHTVTVRQRDQSITLFTKFDSRQCNFNRQKTKNKVPQ